MSTDLEATLRRADPAAGYVPDIDAGTVLAAILDTPGRASDCARPVDAPIPLPAGPAAGRRRRWTVRTAMFASAAAVLAVAVIVLAGHSLAPSAAVAGRVPALVASETGQSRDAALKDLLLKAQGSDDPAGYDPGTFHIRFLNESYVPSGPGSGDPSSVFSPVSETETVITPLPDGRFQGRVTYWGIFSARTGERIPDFDRTTGERIPPGTEVVYEFTREGQQGQSMESTVPDTAEAIHELVHDYSTPDSAMFTGSREVALFEVLGFAMAGWNPSQDQSAAVLELLMDMPHVEFDGQVADRMGRPGLMFSATGSYAPGTVTDDRNTYRHSFIFDPETGHLNAYEQVAGEDIDYFVPGGTLRSATVAMP
ncbi:hypothetical protein ACQ7DA_10610 [Zafaria sp. J156]|uniref:hypothetical protein n=1 Tax=Zafaria sp. J156 TaxID=3116490 RepID=UPI002E76C1CB|nr:hypothetical protein [Zafaria sp. J156]MEE1621631.1 hypothetical protein [Zafaria sp. J156]